MLTLTHKLQSGYSYTSSCGSLKKERWKRYLVLKKYACVCKHLHDMSKDQYLRLLIKNIQKIRMLNHAKRALVKSLRLQQFSAVVSGKIWESLERFKVMFTLLKWNAVLFEIYLKLRRLQTEYDIKFIFF